MSADDLTCTSDEPRFEAAVPLRVVECGGERFAPTVSRDGEYQFRGGRTYGSREDAAAAAQAELDFSTRFWAGQLDDRARAAVVNGTHYRLGDEHARGSKHSRGNYGRTYTLRSLDDGATVTTTNLWYQGIIPDYARKAFADTHEWVTT